MSLLQYMKNTTLDNEDITVKDQRIINLDKIVGEVRESEEWEAVEVNILEIGIEHGKKQGALKTLVKNVEAAMKNFGIDLPAACKGLEISVEEYEEAKKQIAMWEQ